MKHLTGALMASIALSAAVPPVHQQGPSAQTDPHPVWQQGVNYVHLYEDSNNLRSLKSRRSLSALAQIGVRWIALIPFGHQERFDTGAIAFGLDPPDADLAQAIADARRLGLRVMLKPHLWLQDQSDARWNAIRMSNDDAWAFWFKSYERFIGHYARFAQAQGVDLLCVGNELLDTTVEREGDWRTLIQRVRTLYSGPLIYAAHWRGEYDRIGFWDALDYVGINAYFPLSDGADPTLEALKRQAAAVCDRIEAFQRTVGKPIVLTEVGFRSAEGASARPWEWHSDTPASPQEQADCYEAILEAFWGKPWFYGLYWWKWFSDPAIGGPHNTGFSPQNKSAQRVIAKWYARRVE